MQNFDDMWDTIDIDTHDIQVTDDMVANKPANDTIDTPKNPNEDWISEEDVEHPMGWRRFLAGVENHLTNLYTKKKDSWEYRKDNTIAKLQDAKKNGDTKRITSLTSQLRALKDEYFELQQKAKEAEIELNLGKLRAVKNIADPDEYLYYVDHPSEVKKELDTGKYEYNSTKLL